MHLILPSLSLPLLFFFLPICLSTFYNSLPCIQFHDLCFILVSLRKWEKKEKEKVRRRIGWLSFFSRHLSHKIWNDRYLCLNKIFKRAEKKNWFFCLKLRKKQSFINFRFWLYNFHILKLIILNLFNFNFYSFKLLPHCFLSGK